MFRRLMCKFLGHLYPLAPWYRGNTHAVCRRCDHPIRIRF